MYSNGSEYEETDFDDMEDLQKSVAAYRHLFVKQEPMCDGTIIKDYKVFADGELIEQGKKILEK